MHIDIREINALLGQVRPQVEKITVQTVDTVAGRNYLLDAPQPLRWVIKTDVEVPTAPHLGIVHVADDATYKVHVTLDGYGRPHSGWVEVTEAADAEAVKTALVQAMFGDKADLKFLEVLADNHASNAEHWINEHFMIAVAKRGECLLIDGAEQQILAGHWATGPMTLRLLLDKFGTEVLSSGMGAPQKAWQKAIGHVDLSVAYVLEHFSVRMSETGLSIVEKGRPPQPLPLERYMVPQFGIRIGPRGRLFPAHILMMSLEYNLRQPFLSALANSFAATQTD